MKEEQNMETKRGLGNRGWENTVLFPRTAMNLEKVPIVCVIKELQPYELLTIIIRELDNATSFFV